MDLLHKIIHKTMWDRVYSKFLMLEFYKSHCNQYVQLMNEIKTDIIAVMILYRKILSLNEFFIARRRELSSTFNN